MLYTASVSRTVAPLHDHRSPGSGRTGRAHQVGVRGAGPPVLRQGRRVPAARGRPLPRHHPPLAVEAPGYVFGNRVTGSGLDRAYLGKRESDHRTSEQLRSGSMVARGVGQYERGLSRMISRHHSPGVIRGIKMCAIVALAAVILRSGSLRPTGSEAGLWRSRPVGGAGPGPL